MIKAIIFDFAGVVGSNGYWLWLEENVKDLELIKAEFDKVADKVDIGEITEQEFVKFLAEKSGRGETEVWPGIFERIIINQELLEMIKVLRNKYQIGLLSNYVYEWLNQVLTSHQLYDYFDQIIISSRHKMIKPQPEIFNKMLSMLKVNKDEALFIDDRQINVDGSNSLGIKALLFTDTQSLKKDFVNLGVEVE